LTSIIVLFNQTFRTYSYTLSLHDALPIFKLDKDIFSFPIQWIPENPVWSNYIDIWTRIPLATFIKNTAKITLIVTFLQLLTSSLDRKSTRLNSSHVSISYAVFCLKKKKHQ